MSSQKCAIQTGVNFAAAGTAPPAADDWSAQILHGVSTVPSLGTPVSLAVWGDNAQVILTRGFNPQNVLIAAAEHQQGRVIASTATEYTEKFITNDASVSTMTTDVPEYRSCVLNKKSVDFGFTESVHMFPMILVDFNASKLNHRVYSNEEIDYFMCIFAGICWFFMYF